MKNRILSFVLASTLMLTPALATESNNANEHWAKNSIDFVTARELFGGVGDGKFAPDLFMTRGMLVTVIGRMAMLDISKPSKSDFFDVIDDAWYAPYVAWAAENNMIGGVGNQKFAPERAITREEMLTILYQYGKFSGYPLMNGEADLSQFADAESISSWSKEALSWAISENIITGKPGNLIDSQECATRAEVATIIERFIVAMLKR